MRKLESFFYKMKPCLQKLPLALDCRQNKYSLQIFNIHMPSVLGLAFVVLFPCYFQKIQILLIKRFWNNFYRIVLLFASAQKVHFSFLKSCFKLEILIFLPFVLSFLVDMFNWENPFLAAKSETHCNGEVFKV